MQIQHTAVFAVVHVGRVIRECYAKVIGLSFRSVRDPLSHLSGRICRGVRRQGEQRVRGTDALVRTPINFSLCRRSGPPPPLHVVFIKIDVAESRVSSCARTRICWANALTLEFLFVLGLIIPQLLTDEIGTNAARIEDAVSNRVALLGQKRPPSLSQRRSSRPRTCLFQFLRLRIPSPEPFFIRKPQSILAIEDSERGRGHGVRASE